MANKRYGHAEDPPNDRRTLLLTVVLLIILSVTMLLVMRGQLQKHYSVHTISGTSMIPTLTEEDQVLVKKKVRFNVTTLLLFQLIRKKGCLSNV